LRQRLRLDGLRHDARREIETIERARSLGPGDLDVVRGAVLGVAHELGSLSASGSSL
jgi:hypothetical protein